MIRCMLLKLYFYCSGGGSSSGNSSGSGGGSREMGIMCKGGWYENTNF
jgi:hypothetical protein